MACKCTLAMEKYIYIFISKFGSLAVDPLPRKAIGIIMIIIVSPFKGFENAHLGNLVHVHISGWS